MKRITIIHQYFKTPEDGGGIRSWYLAKGLVERGFEVTVISSWNKKEKQEFNLEGINVVYLPVSYYNHYKFWRRIHAFIEFARQAFLTARKSNSSTDLFYLITTPLSVAAIGLFLNKPYLVEVGDLWPDAPIDLGYIQNPILKRMLFGAERKIYANAAGIIALSPAIEMAISEKLRDNKIPLTTITNFADIDYFDFKREGYKTDQNSFRISYIGAIGRANDLNRILEIAEMALIKAPNLRFVIMGEGAEREPLRKKAHFLKLHNLEFIAHNSKSHAKDLLESSDAALVTYAQFSILNTGSPNKLFDGLAAGKLIILNFGGWMKDLVEKQDCGFSYNSERPEEFFEKLAPFLESHSRLGQVQQNARKVAENNFDKTLQIEKTIQFIQNLPGL